MHARPFIITIMVDLYTYDLVSVTPLLEASVNHLLSIGPKYSVSEKLLTELEKWSKDGVELQPNVQLNTDDDDDDDDVKVMPFELVKKIHEQLKIVPVQSNSEAAHSLADLMKGSRIILPKYRPPPRNPELVARLEKIKADLANKEYNKMIGNVDESTASGVLQDVRIDVQATHRQLWMILNFVLTVVGSFVFAYFAALYAGFELIWCYSMGLAVGLTVFFADLYFITKNM